MALTNNPNKTKTIEKAWNREISKRWAKFTAAVEEIPLGSIITNITDPEQAEIDRFLETYEFLANLILLGTDGGEWQNKYQTLAYERSAQRAINDSRSLFTTEELEVIFLFSVSVAGVLLMPANRNELNFLHIRANDALRGWIQGLIKDTKSIIHDNHGKLSKNELINLLKDRIGFSESKARMIATTEITQAAQRASTVQAQALEDALGETVKLRWITQNDIKVRHLHAGWHGLKFTPEQAEVNINISPWNCRCGLKPVVESRDTKKVNKRFKKERKILLARQGQRVG